jgi:hypothetical protein
MNHKLPFINTFCSSCLRLMLYTYTLSCKRDFFAQISIEDVFFVDNQQQTQYFIVLVKFCLMSSILMYFKGCIYRRKTQYLLCSLMLEECQMVNVSGTHLIYVLHRFSNPICADSINLKSFVLYIMGSHPIQDGRNEEKFC